MKAVEVLSLVGGHVDEELLKRNEYLAAENEILRNKIKGRVKLNDEERIRCTMPKLHTSFRSRTYETGVRQFRRKRERPG